MKTPGSDAYMESPSRIDGMMLSGSSGNNRGVWKKPAGEMNWRDPPIQNDSEDQVAEMLRTYADVLESGTDSLRYTDIIAMIRFAREQLAEGSPHIEKTFDIALHLLEDSIRTQHIGNRQLAAKIMIYTNPLLPNLFPPAHKTAEILRRVIMEQEADAATHIQAYAGLIHCFSPDNIEVTEGLALFEGLATRGRTDAIREEARVAYWAMAKIRPPSFHRRP